MRILAVLQVAVLALPAAASQDQIRKSAEKAVALLQKSQQGWKQSCYSCHQQSIPSLAFAAARDHGIAVNEELAHKSAVQGFGFLGDIDRTVQFTHLIDPGISESYALLGAHAAGVRPSLTTAMYARLIASYQKADGNWGTLDVRPPESYSPVTATAVSLHALQLYGHPSLAADTKARVDRARRWLAAYSPRDTEERTMQLMGLFWAGAPKSQLDPLCAALQREQQNDGGWRSVKTRPSDAYSTGEVLVVLHEVAGVPTEAPAWQRGLEFLLRTQAPDGSWHVVSRVQPPAPVSPPYFETGYPYGHDQFISAMGASWAIRALADALGPAKHVEPPELREASPAGIEPWMETVAFGSLGDLRALLDRKFNANSASKTGGSTALMFAMPDAEKAKLLLAHGAQINARTKTKYSAVMVAARYPGSAPAMRLLLERGAEVRMAKGAGTPLFNASPLVIAAMAGNKDVLPTLVKAGDRIDNPMQMLGIFPTTAFQMPVFFDDVESARTLLNCGAAVDLPDDDGITPLGWAAIGNLPDMAKLLIEHGADVNHVDKKGMTPLLYAASTSFGDASVVNLLLKSGAKRDAKTKEGFTASDLVKRYKHAQLYESLNAGI